MKLYKRTIVDSILSYIGDETVIVLHGARQVGKTHILYFLENYLKSKKLPVYYYDLEYPKLLATLNSGVDEFINDLVGRGGDVDKEIYVLIDEIQYLDSPSSFLKIIADHYKNIHLVVTGSSSFDIKTKFTDSLVGRTTDFEIFPLSFDEFLMFKEINIVLNTKPSEAILDQLKKLYIEFATYGGYPQVVLEPVIEKKFKNILQIIDTYVRKDLRDLATVDDIFKFNNLLQVLAYQSGQLINYDSIGVETKLSYPTIVKYLSILEETYIIKLIRPYSKDSSVEISKNPKVFFLDSGIQSVLWLNQFSNNLQGNVLETNIFGELIKRWGRSNVNFWRTKNGTEVDFVVNIDNIIVPFEVKMTFPLMVTRGINFFLTKYGLKNGLVVGLSGTKSKGMIWPWEIGRW